MHFFGNPEMKNLDLQVFYNAYTESGVKFDFQGCHRFFVTNLLVDSNPDPNFHHFHILTLTHEFMLLLFQIDLRNPPFHFQCPAL